MLPFALLGCPGLFTPCGRPSDPLTCEASTIGPDGARSSEPRDVIQIYRGRQGGRHFEVVVDVSGTTEDPDIGAEVRLPDGTVIAELPMQRERSRNADRDTCTNEEVDLQVLADRFDDCAVDGQELTVVVTVEREDGSRATCTFVGVFEADEYAGCDPPAL